jgi:dipeptidyl aminopeptidase/acylaminoacyl peptidase
MLNRATMKLTYARAFCLAGIAAFLLPHASLLGADLQRLTPKLALSPDGREVVYRVDRPRNAQEPRGADVGELWRVLAKGGLPRKLTDAGFDARLPRWSPGGERIAWLARDKPSLPPQLRIAGRDGDAPLVLTGAEGGVQALEWAPDSTKIAYTAWDVTTPDEARAASEGRDWLVVDAPPKQLRLYVFDIRTRTAKLVTRAEQTVHYFDWSPDGSQFVIGAAPTPSEDDRTLRVRPFIVSAAGGEPREIEGAVARVTDPCWSADGKWIAWLGSTSLADPFAGSVFVVAAAGGTPRNLTQGFAGTATSLQALPGSADSFVVRSEERQATTLRSVTATAGSMRLLSAPEKILWGTPSFSADGRTFATAANASTHPNDVFLGRLARVKSLERVTDSNPQLQGIALGAQEIARWRSRDGLDIEGVLIRPVDHEPGKRYPVILHVHGGSENVILNGWQATYNNWGQLLAARGYAVLFPNYRGSRGRGVDFVMGNRRDVMGREWEDTETGLDHLIGLGLADAERAGIYGFSWGGYAAGWGATYASNRFRAAVGGAGIYNWTSEAGTNETRMHEQLAHWDAPLYENFLTYLSRSPIYHVRQARTPMLLLHGELDQSCPVGQAIEMHTALKWKGVPVELVIYPREGHGMDETPHRLDFATRGLGWFDRYLGS